jgi:glucosylceramidase
VVRTTLTTHNRRYALAAMPPQYFVRQRTHRQTVLVNDAIRYQRIIGFGAAMTDSSAWLLQDELTPDQQGKAMQSLFSPTLGIGLNVVRVPIGASDFSATGVPYTYDDNPPNGTDPDLDYFSISHDSPYILPALQAMLAQNPQIKVLSTEWSPPAWMKANNSLDDLNDAGTLQPQYYGALANYFVKFITAYQAAGIPIWAITPENEPQSGAAFPSMYLPAAQEAQFITQNLQPALAQSGLHPLIFGMDGNNNAYATSLEQSDAASALAGMAWHCYGGQQKIGAFHQAYPNVTNITSECSPGIVPYGASETAISGLSNSASLIQLWNLALNPQGGPVQPPDSGCHRCTGLLVINPATDHIFYKLNFYELGQFSKFIRPGAVRVASRRFVTEFNGAPTRPHWGVTPGIDDVAAINPGGRHVLVVYNNSTVERYFAVKWSGQMFNYKLPPGATVTFTWRGTGSGGAPIG